MKRPIYLDYNATTPHDPEVVAAMRPFLESAFGNPSSGHDYGIEPRRAIDAARKQVAGLLGCEAGEVIFTSGGTESNNQAIRGVVRALKGKGNHILTSTIEHPAVLEVCRFLAGEGIETTLLPVDGAGRLDPGRVADAIRPATILISVMHANNEVGTVQPIPEIAAIARRHGIPLHSDAAQSVGKIPCTVDRLGVDLLSLAGHKLYAPKGVGALFVRSSLRIEKMIHGAGQEMGRRAGTENVMGIVGLGKACEIASRDLPGQMARLETLRDRLQAGIAHALPQARFNGHPQRRLPNTLSLSVRGLEADRLLEEIAPQVAASAGAACHAGEVSLSHVLTAMALPRDWAMGTVRFSVGRMTTIEEIDRAVAVVAAAVNRLSGG